MTTLYGCKHSGDEYRITKFDFDLNVLSSYLCTFAACQCPQGERGKTCRHQQMLSKFIQRDAVDTNWFLDFDRNGWVQIGEVGESGTISQEVFDNIVSAANSSPASAEQQANLRILEAGGPVTTEYMTDGNINTYRTIDHEPAPRGPFKIRRR